MSLVAMPLLAVLVLGASPAEMGVLRAVQFAPWLLALAAGVLVDRARRKPLLICADLGRALVFAWIPIASLLGVLTMAQLYLVAVLAGVLSVVFEVAYGAYLPGLVSPSGLLRGNSRLALSRAAAHAAGPALAGALIQLLNAASAIAADASSFLVSGLCLTLIRKPEPRPVRDGRREVLSEVREGLQVVIRDPVLRALSLSAASWNCFSGGVLDAIYILYLSREVALVPAEVAGLITLSGLAGIAGATVAGRAASALGLGRALLLAATVAAVGTLVVPFVDPADPLRRYLLSGVALVVGFAQPMYSVGLSTIGQAVSPDALRGRIAASQRFLLVGVVPIGSLLGGALGETIGPRAALLVAGLGVLLAPLWLLASPVPRFRAADEVC